jgi:hypothetical protein
MAALQKGPEQIRVCDYRKFPVCKGLFRFCCDTVFPGPIRQTRNTFIPLCFHWNGRLCGCLTGQPFLQARRADPGSTDPGKILEFSFKNKQQTKKAKVPGNPAFYENI